jgi:hypothetical protein
MLSSQDLVESGEEALVEVLGLPCQKSSFVKKIPVHTVNFTCMFLVTLDGLSMRSSNVPQLDGTISACCSYVIFVFFTPRTIIQSISSVELVDFDHTTFLNIKNVLFPISNDSKMLRSGTSESTLVKWTELYLKSY